MSREVAAALVALVVVATHVYLMSLAYEDLNRPGRIVRGFDRTGWAFCIAFIGIVGPLAYFRYGRDDPWRD